MRQARRRCRVRWQLAAVDVVQLESCIYCRRPTGFAAGNRKGEQQKGILTTHAHEDLQVGRIWRETLASI